MANLLFKRASNIPQNAGFTSLPDLQFNFKGGNWRGKSGRPTNRSGPAVTGTWPESYTASRNSSSSPSWKSFKM